MSTATFGSGIPSGGAGGTGVAGASSVPTIRRSGAAGAAAALQGEAQASPVRHGEQPAEPLLVTTELIDQIVDRLEARLRDELERRGRWLPWESL